VLVFARGHRTSARRFPRPHAEFPDRQPAGRLRSACAGPTTLTPQRCGAGFRVRIRIGGALPVWVTPGVDRQLETNTCAPGRAGNRWFVGVKEAWGINSTTRAPAVGWDRESGDPGPLPQAHPAEFPLGMKRASTPWRDRAGWSRMRPLPPPHQARRCGRSPRRPGASGWLQSKRLPLHLLLRRLGTAPHHLSRPAPGEGALPLVTQGLAAGPADGGFEGTVEAASARRAGRLHLALLGGHHRAFGGFEAVAVLIPALARSGTLRTKRVRAPQ